MLLTIDCTSLHLLQYCIETDLCHQKLIAFKGHVENYEHGISTHQLDKVVGKHFLTNVHHILTTCQHILTPLNASYLSQHILTTCQHILTTCQHILTTCQHILTTCQHILTTCQHILTTFNIPSISQQSIDPSNLTTTPD